MDDLADRPPRGGAAVTAVIQAGWSSRFHGPGMEEGPAAVAAALGPPMRAAGRDRPRRACRSTRSSPACPACTTPSPRAAGQAARAARRVHARAGGDRRLRAAHPDLVLVWIDAHGDLNTPQTSPSGFLGGMPFAILLGWCHDELRRAAGLEPGPARGAGGARGQPRPRPGRAGRDRPLAARRRRRRRGGARRAPGRRAGAPAPRRRRARPGRRPRRRLPGSGRLERRAARTPRWRRSPRAGAWWA